jgi:hypothetical protein
MLSVVAVDGVAAAEAPMAPAAVLVSAALSAFLHAPNIAMAANRVAEPTRILEFRFIGDVSPCIVVRVRGSPRQPHERAQELYRHGRVA